MLQECELVKFPLNPTDQLHQIAYRAVGSERNMSKELCIIGWMTKSVANWKEYVELT